MNVFQLFATLGLDSSGFKSGLEQAEADVGRFGQGTTFTFRNTVNAALSVAKPLATAALAVGGYAAKVGSDFEAQMSVVESISGATAGDMEALADKAIELGAKTKFSAYESGEAFEFMAQAGWRTADMLAGIEGIMDLAASSGESLALSSQIVTDGLTAFGLAADQAGRFADVLAYASAASSTNVAEMGDAFKYVAPLAGTLGYTIEETATALGLMANNGIKAGTAGTSLRAIIARLADPTKEIQAAMNKYGISLSNTDGTAKSLIEVLDSFRVALGDMTEAEKTATAAVFAGQEGMSGLLSVVNASPEALAQMTEGINNAEGAAKKMADTMQNNLSGAVEELKGATETLGIVLYEWLDEPLTDATTHVTELVGRLTEMIEGFNLYGERQEDPFVLKSDKIKEKIRFWSPTPDVADWIIENFVSEETQPDTAPKAFNNADTYAQSRSPININVNMDGRTVANAIYDPLLDTATQRGY